MTQRIITVPIVNQGNNDILPFTFMAESGYTANNSTLNFTMEVVSQKFLEYQAVIDRDNTAVMANTSSQATYVPKNAEAEITHKSSFYVDVIGKDISGIKDIRTHVEPYGYNFETINDEDNVFRIPKFTWENTLVPSITRTNNKYMWVGTSSNELNNVEYTNTSGTIISTEDLGSPVYKIMFGYGNDRMYVSSSNNLYKYAIGYYSNTSSNDFYQELSVENPYRIIMSSYNNDFVWGVESYYGKVSKLDPDTLSIIKEYSGIDAPFKVVYSSFHQAFFVAGSYWVWKIDDVLGTVKAVYGVNNYKVSDIDVSEDGKLCILLSGISDNYIRVLDSDVFTILLNEKVMSVLRYCSYCGKGKFYILSELNYGTGSSSYSATHYIFDSNSKVLGQYNSDDYLLLTTTTTTPGIPSGAVQIVSPNGGESFQIGEKYDIQWISSKSISDYVKIDLYKSGVWYSTISDKTLNSGIYPWTVDKGIEGDSDYKIRIMWLAASSDPSNSSTSTGYFSILQNVVLTTTTTTTKITEEAIGVSYDNINDQIVIMLKSGSYMLFDMVSHYVYGLNASGVSNPISLAVKNVSISSLDKQSKIRVFIGSQKYASDRWDSGEIETELTSIYYGGGNNLVPGQVYYAHIQTYSNKFGWGEIQIRQFVMPR